MTSYLLPAEKEYKNFISHSHGIILCLSIGMVALFLSKSIPFGSVAIAFFIGIIVGILTKPGEIFQNMISSLPVYTTGDDRRKFSKTFQFKNKMKKAIPTISFFIIKHLKSRRTDMSRPEKSVDILIADDEPTNLTILTQVLIQEGYEVRPALSGELAIESAASKPPDLIILDISMPTGLDGYEVCKHLKSRGTSKDIPIIFISALHDPSDKVRAFQAGGQDFISKPFRIDDVQERVRAQLRLRDTDCG